MRFWKPYLVSLNTEGCQSEFIVAKSQDQSVDRIPPASSKDISAENQDTGTNERVTVTPSKKPWYVSNWPRGSPTTSVIALGNEGGVATSDATNGNTQKLHESPRKAVKSNLATPNSTSSPYLSRNKTGTSRSTPLAATLTKLNVVSQASNFSVKDTLDISKYRSDNQEAPESRPDTNTGQTHDGEHSDHGASQTDIVPIGEPPAITVVPEVSPTLTKKSKDESFGWLRWLSNNADINQHTEKTDKSTPTIPSMDADSNPKEQQRPLSPISTTSATQTDLPTPSWMGLWRSTAGPLKTGKPAVTTEKSANEPGVTKAPQSTTESLEPVGGTPEPALSSPASPAHLPRSSVSRPTKWVFWSNEKPKDGNLNSGIDSKMAETLESPQKSHVESAQNWGMKVASGKCKEPQQIKTSSNQSSVKVLAENLETITDASIVAVGPNSGKGEQLLLSTKQSSENLLLPLIKDTYRATEKPSLIQRLNYFLKHQPLPNDKHVNLQEPGAIKNALAIGVHGYFPAPLIRSVLGQPTGTSTKFASRAADAIQRWTKARGYACKIEKVALEGQGKIAERVELLWKLLLDWIENIRKADFVMIACHSQGVPVAVMLVAKLIAFGCVNHSRISVCALAGVNLGPFADYKSRWIGGSAGELFDFAIPESQVTKDYEVALNTALTNGAKIVYIGSIDDQLVSLESSTFGTLCHPCIYRAVFIDGRIHAPDFLTHVVGFALKLRNLGISDHGLIRELSSPLAGSLYSGEGHSRIYDDDSVYDLAIEFTLETTSVGKIPIQINRSPTQSSQNPYILPFAMRGLLEEEHVRTALRDETKVLLRLFDEWKPSSKVLKDVKFRLEGIRSKL